MGARKGVPHAPAGSGSIGKSWDKKAGKWIWRGRVTLDTKRHYGEAVVQQPGMTDATCRRLARQNLDKTIADVRANTVIPPEKLRARLSAYLDLWLAAQRDALPEVTTTYRNYESDVRLHIRPFLGRERIANITSALLLDWRKVIGDEALQRQRHVPADDRGVRSRQVIKMASAFLRRILRDAHAASYPVNTEVLSLKDPRGAEKQERPFLTEPQADLLCQAAPAPRDVVWRTTFYGGLRDGELRGLKWKRVLWTKGALDVQEQLDREGRDRAPKKGSSGEVFVPDFVMAELRDHQRWSREQGFPTGLDDYVFLRRGRGGRVVPYSHHQLWADLKADALAAKLDPEIAMHSLRHGLGMTTAAVATPLATKDQLRHRLLTTTAVYTAHRDTEGQRRAAARIGAARIAQKNAQKDADAPAEPS